MIPNMTGIFKAQSVLALKRKRQVVEIDVKPTLIMPPRTYQAFAGEIKNW